MSSNSDSGVRVLVVEDDRAAFERVECLLSGRPGGILYTLDWTPGLETGWAALATARHDLCLLDHTVGERDAFALLQRASLSSCEVPIVFLTERADPDLERRVLASGASDYLVRGDLDRQKLERAVRHSVERAKMLRNLRGSERQLRAVFDFAIDAMLLLDDQTNIVDANPAALTLCGLTRDDILRRRALDIVPAQSHAKAAVRWEELTAAGKASGETRLLRIDGTERTVEYRATASVAPGRHLVLLRDITERRRAEERQLRLVAMVESAADAVETLSADGLIEYWSPSAERIYGLAARDVVGRYKSSFIPPDRVAELHDWLRRVREGEAIQNAETLHCRKDGTLFAASVTLSPIWQGSEVVAISLISRDISEKKLLEERLAVSDRMVSLGMLAAGVAHEINNPLASLIANLNFMSEELPSAQGAPFPRVAEALQDASSSANRLREVMRDLKLFSRPDEEQRGPVDLHAVIDSTLRVAWNELRHRAQVVKDFGDIAPVFGNEARLGQVILNLVVNAAQAIKEGAANQNEVRLVTRMKGDGQVSVEVRDTGAGIEPSVLSRLFEPFFTTKPVGIGTGLGLSICRRIIHEFGGTIIASSELGKGTSFVVTLPASRPDSVAPSEPQAPAPRPTATGQILVIDDEPLIAKAVQRALSRLHEVTIFPGARPALEQLQGGKIYDVILCDMMMPQMTGIEFYEELKRTVPEQVARVVFLTGGVFTPEARNFLEQVPNLRVEKPFNVQGLRTLISERVEALRSLTG